MPSFGAFSLLLGLPDLLYGFQALLKKQLLPSLRHWTDGWGDISMAQKLYQEVRISYEKHCKGPEYWGNSVTIVSEEAHPTGKVLHGSLRSPLQVLMPANCGDVPFEIVLPAGEPWAIVVILAGTGDESYLYRRKAFAEPLREHGVASILPTMPFYGPRRREGQRLFYLKTFYDIMLQCYAGCTENICLLDWARLQYPEAVLGIVGISHGAGAAVATATYACHDLAVVPLLIPTSAAVLATGSLQHDLALDALGAGGQPGQSSYEEVREVVVDTLERAVGPDAGGEVSPPGLGSYTKCVDCVSAAHDAFILPEWSKKAVKKVKEILDPDAKHYWVAGGHVSSFLVARWRLSKFVLKSLYRLDKNRVASGSLTSKL